jgi:hypothetical protein
MAMAKTHYALIQCGEAKASGSVPAKEKYTSSYSRKKVEFADAFCEEMWILSAKFGVIPGDRLVPDYNVTPDDHSKVERGHWIASIEQSLRQCVWPGNGVLWVLVAGNYLDVGDGTGRTVADAIEAGTPPHLEINLPFRQTSGIGYQMGWAGDCINNGVPEMPAEMPAEY